MKPAINQLTTKFKMPLLVLGLFVALVAFNLSVSQSASKNNYPPVPSKEKAVALQKDMTQKREIDKPAESKVKVIESILPMQLILRQIKSLHSK